MVVAFASTCLTKTDMSAENDASLDVSGRGADIAAPTPAPSSDLPADTTAGPSTKTQLRVGRLTKAHGLKGAIKVELYTDDPKARFVPGASFTLQVPENSPWHRKTLTLREFRWMNSHPVAFFEGIDDRDAAEELIRAILWVDQDLAAAPTEDNAWYDHQLVGLEALRDGVVIGRLVRVEHMPAQDLLIIKTDAGDVMVPFVAPIVPSVDLAAGTITITPPPGLFEELPAEEGDEQGETVDASADAAETPENDTPETHTDEA